MSSLTRHWTWYDGERCRVYLDIERSTTESAVESNSILDVVQRKALSSLTQYWNLVQRKALTSLVRQWTDKG